MKMLIPAIFTAGVLAISSVASDAAGIPPATAPVERIIRNQEAFIRENPESAPAYFVLGRAHFLAFMGYRYISDTSATIASTFTRLPNTRRLQINEEAHRRALEIMGAESAKDMTRADQQRVRQITGELAQKLDRENWQPEPASPKQNLDHAEAAMADLNKSIELDSKTPIFFLSRASVEREFLQYKRLIDSKIPQSYPLCLSIDEKQMVADFRTAYLLDSVNGVDSKPENGLSSLVRYEAGNILLEITKKNPSALPKPEIDEIEAHIGGMDLLPRPRAMSPIIFSVERDKSLGELLAPGGSALFDLDGDGRVERWSWVRPDTAILVWDPYDLGIITSGRQLFGSVTWWLLFGDGYRALDSLDDNRDGELSGAELAGIAAWFDRNGNGQSEPGEVVSLESLGITAISTQATGRVGEVLMNAVGITIRDGRKLPSYDWIAHTQ